MSELEPHHEHRELGPDGAELLASYRVLQEGLLAEEFERVVAEAARAAFEAVLEAARTAVEADANAVAEDDAVAAIVDFLQQEGEKRGDLSQLRLRLVPILRGPGGQRAVLIAALTVIAVLAEAIEPWEIPGLFEDADE